MTTVVEVNLNESVNEASSAKKSKLVCFQCKTAIFKYKCPKCNTLTCSLECCNEHKEKLKCDGVRLPWAPVTGISQFNDKKSIDDQQFLHSIKANVKKDYSKDKKPQHISAYEPEKHDDDNVIQDLMSINTDSFIEDFMEEHEKDANGEEIVREQFKSAQQGELSATEKYLLSNAHRRRIWLNIKDPKESDGSRHERFSDTIFWTITLKFVRDLHNSKENLMPGDIVMDFLKEDVNTNNEEEGEIKDLQSKISEETIAIDAEVANEKIDANCALQMEEAGKGENSELNSSTQNELGGREDIPENDPKKISIVSEYTVKNIPETLTVSTLLRQFLKPKVHGPLISRADIDMENMAPFIEQDLPKLMLYMEAPLQDKERYYIVDANKTLLENLRNRFVNGHPTFLVAFSHEFENLPILTEDEARQMHNDRRQEYQQRFSDNNRSQNRQYSNQRGGGGAQHYNNRQNFNKRGGGRGGGNYQRNNNNSNRRQGWNNNREKRSYQDLDAGCE